MIDLTPLEVRKKKGDFRRALRGYEPALVDDFLDIVADRLEQLVRENASFTERVTRLEQQVSDYRDRERALTDALVTAQEMREEIKVTTTREAEMLRRKSEQEAETRLREAEQQAEATIREAEQQAEMTVRDAEQRAEERLRSAHQEADTRLRQAYQEADARLRQAEQESQAMMAEATQLRQREEEQLREVRARQQQMVTTYRALLQRELTELGVLEAPDTAPAVRPPASPPPPPARAAQADAVVLPPLSEPEPEPDPAWRPMAFEPEPEAVVLPEPEPLAAASAFPDEEIEPFEPEPVYEEDLREVGLTRIEPVELLRESVPDVAAESGAATAEEWPSLDILEEGQVPDFTRPKPRLDALELPLVDEPPPAPPAAAAAPPARAPQPDRVNLADLLSEDEDERPLEDEDPETKALLENAARAGYKLDLDDDAELLLDDPVPEGEATSAQDEGDWLDTIIEEGK